MESKLFVVEGKGTLSLPCNNSSNTSQPLHLQTNWKWTGDRHIMYHITFEGHLFGAAKPISAIAVGYLNAERGHCFDDISHMTNAVRITTYESTNGHLTFKMVPCTDWHASSLSLTLYRGENEYHKAGWDTFGIISVWHE